MLKSKYKITILSNKFDKFLSYLSANAYEKHTGIRSNRLGLLDQINQKSTKNHISLLRRGIDDVHIFGPSTNNHMISKAAKIPIGNWYILHEATPADGGEFIKRTVVNIGFDQYGTFVARGVNPLFLPCQYLYYNEIEKVYGMTQGLKGPGTECTNKDINWGQLYLFPVSRMVIFSILSRLNQIRDKTGRGIANIDLLNTDIQDCLRNSIVEPSNTHNHRIKVLNRITICPYNITPDEELTSNNGSWFYNSTHNKSGTFSDQLDANVDPDFVSELISEFDWEVGEGAEASAQKGTYVILDPSIQNAKREYNLPSEVPFTDENQYYEGVLVIRNINDKSLVSIYPDSQKAYHRLKSLTSANYAKFDCNQPDAPTIYDRKKCFLHSDKRLIHEHDPKNLDTTYNITVVFEESSSELIQLFAPGDDGKGVSPEDLDDYFKIKQNRDDAIELFEKTDKQLISALLDQADCHLKISEDIGNTLVVLPRSIKIDVPENCFTSSFTRFLRKDAKPIVFANENSDYPLDTPIAYEVSCSECENPMVPCNQLHNIVYMECPILHDEWKCSCCGNTEKLEIQDNKYISSHVKVHTFKMHYPTAEKVVLKGIDFTSIEQGIPLNIDVSLRSKGCRAVNPEGMKGFTIVTGKEHLGYINGQMYDPESDGYIEIDNLPVDMIIPYGALKGKESGQILGFLRAVNALTGSTICPDEIYARYMEFYKDKLGNDFNIDIAINDVKQEITSLANTIYDKSDLTLTRKIFKPFGLNSKKKPWGEFVEQTLHSKTDKFRFAVVNFGVTEVNDEFLKYKDRNNPMKVSPMNAISYNILGLSRLETALRKASFVNVNDEKTKYFIKNLMLSYGFQPSLDHKEITRDELRSAPKMVFDYSPIKKEWDELINSHPYFDPEINANGLKIRFNCKDLANQELYFVIPPRDVLLNKIIVKERNGNKIRIHQMLLNIMQITSTLVNAPDKVTKAWLERYRNGITKLLEGKNGKYAELSTYIMEGFQGKETGDGKIPPGVTVIANKEFWNKKYKEYCFYNPIFANSFSDDKERRSIFFSRVINPDTREDSIDIFGTMQRDPNIWFTQNSNNSVKIWHPARADKHFRYYFGISFFEYYPDYSMKKGNQGGILSNVLDMIYIKQSDSDGDMARIICNLDPDVQKELESLNLTTSNYSMFCDQVNYPHVNTVYNSIKWWHLEYLIDEAASNVSKAKSWAIEFSPLSKEDRRSAMLNAVHAKRSIGMITVSQWMIQLISGFLYKTNHIDYDDMLRLCVFYQTVVTQNGCIRSVKHVADALNRLTHDKIAINSERDIIEHVSEDGTLVKVKPLDKLLLLMDMYGYPESTKEAFTKVIKFWHDHSKVDLEKDKINRSEATIYAQTLKAYSTIMYGNKSGLLRNQNIFEALRSTVAADCLMYDMLSPVVDLIQSVQDDFLLKSEIHKDIS